MTKKDEIEKPEIDITESHSDRVTTDSEKKRTKEDPYEISNLIVTK